MNGCEMLRSATGENMELFAELYDIIQVCAKKEILFVCDGLVDKNLWDKVDTAFKSRLLDSLKNSIYKLEISQAKHTFDRRISLKFMEKNGDISFEVSDNADDFPVKIFSKLKRTLARKNVNVDIDNAA